MASDLITRLLSFFHTKDISNAQQSPVAQGKTGLPLDQVIQGDCIQVMKALPDKSVDLIFADPPYAEGSGTAIVHSVVDSGWLARGGWMIVETGRGDVVDPAELAIDSARDVGRARLTFLRRL